MSNRQRWFAIFSLIAAPLALAGIEMFHPAHFTADPGMSTFLSHPQPHDPHYRAIMYFGPEWWFLLHMIQTPLVVVVSFGLLWLTDTFGMTAGMRGIPFAWLSRLATIVFMTYCTVLDGIGGIGLGRELLMLKSMSASGSLSAVQSEAIRFFLDEMWVDPWVGGVGSFVSLTASWAVLVAAVAAAIYLRLNRRISWPVVLLLVGFGWELQVAHASIHGPIAFSLLAIASALMLARKAPVGASAQPASG